MLATAWIPVLLDYDRDEEFTGDDADQFSTICNLGGAYEFVTVILPIMDSADVTLYVQKTDAVDEIPALLYVLDYDAAGALVQTSATVSTAAFTLTYRIGGAQFFRLKCSANQDPDITFYCRGFNRN